MINVLASSAVVGVVMINVLASSAVVDGVFEPRSGQTEENNIGSCCFFIKHAFIWLGIGITCPSGTTCLPANRCSSPVG